MSYEEDLSEKVQFEIIDQVAWITINNPDKGNAMSPGMRDRMTGLFESLNGQFDARAVVLTATGQKLFCPGADISVGREYAQRPDDAPALAVGEPRRMMLRGQ
ncbi:MAG: enoyl-CoA hydratase/isomerase family protein, partial [Acidimicrobiales bacterium]